MSHLEDALARGPAPVDREGSGRAARGLADQAAERGLLDVAYATVDSPLGPLLLAATPRGLIQLLYEHGDRDELLERISDSVSPRLLEAPARLGAVRGQLEQYFEGRRREFDLPVDWRLTAGFARRVLRATARIPYGEVLSYQQVAARAGSPRGSRAAGNALGSNPIAIVVPCHRVIRAGGDLGGYGGGPECKEFLLRLEGGWAP